MSEVTAEMIERGRRADPKTAAHRRSLSLKLRETREKLTSTGTGYRAFDVELLRLFAQSHKSSAPAVILMMLTIAGMSTLWAALHSVLIWLALVTMGLALTYSFADRFLAIPANDVNVVFWRRIFVLGETLQGMVWGLIIIMLTDSHDTNVMTFVLFVLLLLAAMTAMIAATVPLAVYCGLAPITLCVVLFMYFKNSFDSMPLTLLAAGAQMYFVVLANRIYKTSVDTLTFQAEKDALIGELEQAKSNSDEARRRAEEANLAKSRFLATMSHELRTPLNAILGFSEVMQNELFGKHGVAAYKEYSADIHSSGHHLLKLINEILDLSRVEAGRLELREESFSLAHIVEDCHHLLNLRASKRGIKVTQTIEAGLPKLWADERAMRQITLNLLSNAIKFTPQGGAVCMKVGWTKAGGQYLSIRDNGPGIPEDEIPVVMSSFGRGSLAQKNAEEGSGLGLPIVKGLVELHGGTFTLRSKVREGTEVIVVLPPERVMAILPQLDPNMPVPAAVARATRPAA